MTTPNNNPDLLNVTEGRKTLRILDGFEIDTTLPKHAARATTGAFTTSSGGMMFAGGSIRLTGTSWAASDSVGSVERKPGLFARLWSAIRNHQEQRQIAAATIPVQQVFEAIIGSGKKLEVLEGRLEANQAAIAEARAMGQTALAEQLQEQTPVLEMEAVLYAAGHREYISEDQLVDFAQRCERGLRLDRLANFTRLIPHDVRVKKTRMDALMVFDGWAILHYDPENKGAALTKAEIEKKKDPILFGLLRGSRRLYHVASWEDEFCDLTFAALLDRYGKKALTLN